MTKVTDHLKNAQGKTIFSIEIIPPAKGSNSIEELLTGIEPMMELKPPFIDVTYHREEYFIKDMPDGGKKEVKTRRRPGTVGICSAIMHKFNVDPVPHVLCGGFTKEDTEDLLFDLNYLGIDNVMALRGDIAKPFNVFKPKSGGHAFASELIGQISDLNKGKYLYDEEPHSFKTDFCIGAAAYPEKHFEAVDLETDLDFLKKKIDAGADYIVTQMFFNNSKYFDFVDKCRAADISVPIIPGLKVLANKRQMEILPKLFYCDMPDEFKNEVENAASNEIAKEIGIEWCVHQCKELKEYGVPALHFYTMSKSSTTLAVAQKVF
ncbi:methylenetetrahydrofolate reductase [Jiulongibacter sp. NS-SX5]|uniref:methylenetetrahydrofolate reductase n=1 Tax=Jiulongibacter sp. NS-SX5 TaxID=3463854 RepID=UPI0040594507